jgi:hypothetical protein
MVAGLPKVSGSIRVNYNRFEQVFPVLLFLKQSLLIRAPRRNGHVPSGGT